MQEDVKSSDINEAAAQKLKNRWDDFSASYTQTHQYITAQFVVALYHQTRAYESTRHLDVACGSGLGALILTAMMKTPATQSHLLVTSDISPSMLEVMAQRFKDAGFMKNGDNSYFACSEEIEEEPLSFPDEKQGIHVKSYVANNEKLPFASDEFNSYTANLSLMLVDNHKNQLKEAYRVLRNDGIAGFTVWGRRENSSFFTLMSKAWIEAGLKFPKDSHDNYYLGVDKQRLVEDAKSVGFKKAVAYYVPIFANFKDEEEAYKRLTENPRFKQIPPEKESTFKEKYLALYKEYQEERGGLGLEFEALYLIAYK